MATIQLQQANTALLNEAEIERALPKFERFSSSGRVYHERGSAPYDETGRYVIQKSDLSLTGPIKLQECGFPRIESIHQGNRILMLEARLNMYMGTPGLGTDCIFHEARGLNWQRMAAILEVEPKDDRNVKVTSINTHLWCPRGLSSSNADSLADLIADYNPSVIGISAMSKELRWIIDLLKNSGAYLQDKLIVVGGMHATAAPHEIMRSSLADTIDMVFHSESTSSFGLLLTALNKAKREPHLVTQIPGTIFRQQTEDGIIIRSNRDLPSRVPTIAPPPLKFTRPMNWSGESVIHSVLSRGCGEACTFCAVDARNNTFDEVQPECDPNAKKKWVSFNIEGVKKSLDAMYDYLYRNKWSHGEHPLLYFEDGNFGGDPESPRMAEQHTFYRAVLEHCVDLNSRNPNFQLKLGVQLRWSDMTPEYIDLMDRAGVRYIFTSVESLSAENLKRMAKRQTASPEQIYSTCADLTKRGIEYMISFIGGMPGDSVEQVLLTASFVRLLGAKNVAFEIAKAYPGAADATIMKKRGIDVAHAYTTGEGVTPFNPELGPEEMGVVFSGVTVDEAINYQRAVHNLFMNGEGVCDSSEAKISSFNPLGSAIFTCFRPGFYQAVEMPPISYVCEEKQG